MKNLLESFFRYIILFCIAQLFMSIPKNFSFIILVSISSFYYANITLCVLLIGYVRFFFFGTLAWIRSATFCKELLRTNDIIKPLPPWLIT